MDFFGRYESIENKLSLEDITGKNIITCLANDLAIYWVYYLDPSSENVSLNQDYIILYSKKHDIYFIYFINAKLKIVSEKIGLLTKTNYVHFILCAFSEAPNFIRYFEDNEIPNFNYSLVNYMSEPLFEDQPHNLETYKKLKYYFSSTEIFKRVNGSNQLSNFQTNYNHKFKLDYKYSLTYFYIKLGFNYFQKGNNLLSIDNRINKVFLYSKTKTQWRKILVDKAKDTGRIYEKPYLDEDWFWGFFNYNQYHTPFYVDYNTCKFNLVTETQPIDGYDLMHNFLSEKTLKALMVDTPSYVLLKKEVLDVLVDYGFYFLNLEFGGQGMENYDKFCNFLTSCSEDEFNNLFSKSFEKSKLNKLKLEEYIYSIKDDEIKLLIK
jgi:hypothetical protein